MFHVKVCRTWFYCVCVICMHKKGKVFFSLQEASFFLSQLFCNKIQCGVHTWLYLGKCIKGKLFFCVDFSRFKIEREKMSPKYIRIVQKEGVPSLVVCDGFVNILFFLVYINRMFRTFFLLQQSPEGQRRWWWCWWENWNTRGKSFFRSENSSFSKLLSFHLQHSSTLFLSLNTS